MLSNLDNFDLENIEKKSNITYGRW